MLEMMLVSSLEKVGVQDKLVLLGEEAALSVFQGEKVSFQVAWKAGREEQAAEIKAKIHVSVRAMEEDSHVPDCVPEVRVRQVLPVMCRRSCNPDSVDENYLFYDARMAPDLLRDVGEEVAAAGEGWQSLWVDVNSSKDQKPGKYCVEIEVAFGGCQKVCKAVVQVRKGSLPKLPIYHTEWFHLDGIADYYRTEVFSEEFWRILKNFLAVYVKRKCNTILVPVLTPPLDTEVGGERTTVQLADVELCQGEYRLDFANLERYLDICLEAGIETFEICHLFSQWGATAAPKVVADVDGTKKQIFGWDTPSDDPEYLRFLGVLLPSLTNLLRSRGLLERTFFHISDEPDLNAPGYQAAQGKVRELLSGCTIIEAVSDYAYYEKGLVDIPVCAVDHIEPFLDRRPPRLWSYYCCVQTKEVPNRFISMPSWRNRIYGILAYWLEIEGILHWGFNFYNSQLSKKHINPYETVDADQGFPAGDPFMVYPGEDGVPEESIRLMVLDEALDDYRTLYALETLVGREQVMELIRKEAGMELSFRQYPRNAEFILRLREKADCLLEELQA